MIFDVDILFDLYLVPFLRSEKTCFFARTFLIHPFFSEKRWNYKENSQSNKENIQKEMSEDMKSWLIENNWKIRKLHAEINGKPLAELIRLDERLIVVIDEEKKKMLVLNDINFEDF